MEEDWQEVSRKFSDHINKLYLSCERFNLPINWYYQFILRSLFLNLYMLLPLPPQLHMSPSTIYFPQFINHLVYNGRPTTHELSSVTQVLFSVGGFLMLGWKVRCVISSVHSVLTAAVQDKTYIIVTVTRPLISYHSRSGEPPKLFVCTKGCYVVFRFFLSRVE